MASHELAHVNLNLLVALDALLQERNVRRAAERMSVTQSAMSRTLAQLRELFDDPILVRSGNSMLATPRASDLAAPLGHALRELGGLLEGPSGFEPLRATRRFTVAASDAVAVTVLPGLVEGVSRDAPNAGIDVVPVRRDGLLESMERGDVDLFIGAGVRASSCLLREALFPSSFAVLARAGHPAIADELDIDIYCRLPHAMVTVTGRGGGVVDSALARLGRSRVIALRVPYFLAAPPILASTDFLLTLPSEPARYFAGKFPLRVYDAPLPLPRGRVEMIWHQRYDRNPALVWLRQRVIETLARGEP